MINKVILVGNLGQDPEVRKLESGVSVGRFSVATSESYKDKEGEWRSKTEWHNVVVWRNLAENAERNLKKGMQVYIEGKLSTSKWQDKDGSERRTTDIIANTMRILGRNENKSNTNNSTNNSTNTNNEPEDLPF